MVSKLIFKTEPIYFLKNNPINFFVNLEVLNLIFTKMNIKLINSIAHKKVYSIHIHNYLSVKSLVIKH
jgi:hypothetical protein